MIQNASATVFHGVPGAYTRTELSAVLWQETMGIEAEKRGLAPEEAVKVFVPVDTVVEPGDRLAWGIAETLPADAWLVTGVLVRNYGSMGIQHKEVHCQ